jgi:hypothetical protein
MIIFGHIINAWNVDGNGKCEIGLLQANSFNRFRSSAIYDSFVAEARTPLVDPSLRALHRIASSLPLHDSSVMDYKDTMSMNSVGSHHTMNAAAAYDVPPNTYAYANANGPPIMEELSFLSRARGSSAPETLPGIVN